MHNENEVVKCVACGDDLAVKSPAGQKIFFDICRLPFKILIKMIYRSSKDKLFMSITLPFLLITYAIKKISKRPWWIVYWNNITPKLTQTHFDASVFQTRKPLQEADTFFSANDFEAMIDFEDSSYPHGLAGRLYRHRDKKIFGYIFFTKSVPKSEFCSFSAITNTDVNISVHNSFYQLPIEFPENVIVSKTYPEVSIEALYRFFVEEINHRELAALSLTEILKTNCRMREIVVEAGIEQGIFKKQDETTSSVATCYHHPTTVAVRECSECGVALCDACFSLVGQRYYCSNCSPTTEKEITFDKAFAGFAVRTLAIALDAVIIYFLLKFIKIAVDHYATQADLHHGIRLYFIQLFFVLLIGCYFIVPVYYFGWTIGKKILGLEIVDRFGNSPGMTAVFIRFGYFVLSLFFIFPMIGYAAPVIRKTKRGFHDQLADTYVITNHSKAKAFVSWGLIMCAAYFAYPQIQSIYSYFYSPEFRPEPSVVFIEPEWALGENDFSDMVAAGNLCVISTTDSIRAVGANSGETIWKNTKIANAELIYASESNRLMSVGIGDKARQSLFCQSVETGDILWSQPFALEDYLLNYDQESVVACNKRKMMVWNADGQFQYEYEFDGELEPGGIYFDTGILIWSGWEDQGQKLTYFDRKKDHPLWERKEVSYYMVYPIRSGLFSFNSEAERRVETTLYDVNLNRILWTSPIAGIQAHHDFPENTLLYGRQSAIALQDGKTVFTYPEDSRFLVETGTYLMTVSKPDSNRLSNKIFLLDQRTGELKKQYDLQGIQHTFYLGATDSHIYLAVAMQKGKEPYWKNDTQILAIDLTTLGLTIQPLGQNLFVYDIRFYPEYEIVTISSFHSRPDMPPLAAYRMPLM